jgi:GT2 family glycosyltransferase
VTPASNNEMQAGARVAVLCVTHGRPDYLRDCLASCARQDHAALDIVVVLNPADAASEAAVRAAAPGARIVRTHRNLGFFPALNLALANTDADYVMIVDDDAKFVADDALTRLLAEFAREPALGAVTCNLEGPSETPITGGDRYIRVFTTGFTMLPRKAFTEWIGYFPDLFFRSAGETYVCTQLWEQRRPVKRVEGVRMYHALAQQGRSMRDWRFYGLRSQVLCAIMREPALWLLPVLASKFGKSLVQYIRWGNVGIWLHVWLSVLLHLPEALRLRRPISPATRRLLARLDGGRVQDLAALPEWQRLAAGKPAVA